MDERREPPPPPGSQPPITGGAKLAPPQEAWGAYVEHATHCPNCRSLDAGRCTEADTLYRAYQKADSDALRQLHGGRP